MSLLAQRLNKVKPSPTLAVTAKAKELSAQGIEIISLAAGEPDFGTPENIKEAAIDAINNGVTKYTAVAGTLELKQAVCNKFIRENNLDYNPEQVIISAGGKQVIYNLFMATINEGDEVIIQKPYWVSYPDMILLAGGVPVFLDANQKTDFKVTPDMLSEAITPKTKWFILNSPSNPSGVTYTKEELLEIAKILRVNPHVHILCDDIYEHIIFDNFEFKTFAEIAPDLKDRIFIINGVSKAYSMTGWRIGYGVGDASIIKAMTLIQSQSTSNPSSISQSAAVEALNGPQEYLAINAKNFQKKRDLIIERLEEIGGFECIRPQGAFYLFINCSSFYGKKTKSGKAINTSTDLATYLLEESNVAIVPGIAFGMDDYIRISYATSEDLINKACDNISEGISKLV